MGRVFKLVRKTRSEMDSGTKTTQHLFVEYQDGESKLYKENNEIFREVRVAQLLIQHPHKNEVLVEIEQYLPGQKEPRIRNIYPSEKCKYHESPHETAVRGLKEELLFEKNYNIVFSHEHSEQKLSSSYNKLITNYNVYTFVVNIEDTLLQPRYTICEDDGKVSVFIWRKKSENQ